MKIQTSLNKIQLFCVFSHFDVIWVIIFYVQNQFVTGF